MTLVAITRWGQDDDGRRARNAGFDRHVTKPGEIASLQLLIAELHARNAYRGSVA